MLSPSIRRKLDTMVERQQEVSLLLADMQVISDNNRFRTLSKEYAQLTPASEALARFDSNQVAIKAAQAMLQEDDLQMREMAKEELRELEALHESLSEELHLLLIPPDPNDDACIFLEVRAGTGGDEAAIFAGDLFRMYTRYAERKGWRVEVQSSNDGEHGGFKEAIARFEGSGVYRRMKFESGTHRVQRVPETETQGRIHTSACTVAILPEAEEIKDIEINPADLKVDTFRSSGAGGQHVNKTESAIRITHMPSGIVVECQTERSQHANRDKAMNRLKASLLDGERAKQQSAQSESRRLQVGSGDRSQRIRTYNFPQGRLTDHRINLTLYSLDNIIEGDLDGVIDPLLREYQSDLLKDLTGING